MLLSSVLIVAAGWTFHSAPLAAEKASGNEVAADVHTLRVSDRGGCGWWETSAAIAPQGGVRFRATAEIALDGAKDFVYNNRMGTVPVHEECYIADFSLILQMF